MITLTTHKSQLFSTLSLHFGDDEKGNEESSVLDWTAMLMMAGGERKRWWWAEIVSTWEAGRRQKKEARFICPLLPRPLSTQYSVLTIQRLVVNTSHIYWYPKWPRRASEVSWTFLSRNYWFNLSPAQLLLLLLLLDHLYKRCMSVSFNQPVSQALLL